MYIQPVVDVQYVATNFITQRPLDDSLYFCLDFSIIQLNTYRDGKPADHLKIKLGTTSCFLS